MSIVNDDDIVDSRDVIARIEHLEQLEQPGEVDLGDDNDTDQDTLFAELAVLRKLQAQAEASPDWSYGETLIRDSYFTAYTEELINDCYEMPKDLDSGKWPWRHMKIDFEAAADELKSDYIEVDWDGVPYWIRA